MKYIPLILFLSFLGCQTTKFKKQARKGWQRVDKEWGGQAKMKAPGLKTAAARTPSPHPGSLYVILLTRWWMPGVTTLFKLG